MRWRRVLEGAAGGHASLYPYEVMVVWVGELYLATVTNTQYGCGAKVTVKVVVAAFAIAAILRPLPLMSMLLQLRLAPVGGNVLLLVLLEVANELPAKQVPVTHFRSQYSAHSAPVSAA